LGYHAYAVSYIPSNSAERRWSEAVRTYERRELALRKELDMALDEQTKKPYRNII